MKSGGNDKSTAALFNKDEFLGRIRVLAAEEIHRSEALDDAGLMHLIEKTIISESQGLFLTLENKRDMANAAFNAIRRLGVLQPFMDDRDVTEIMANGYDSIFIEKEGYIRRVNASFHDAESYEDTVQNLVSRANRVVNEASPIVDARLADGSRISVVLPPVALNGPILTIRRFPDTALDMGRLISLGSISEEAVAFLNKLVKARYNIFVSGSTGSGKTSLLNALAGFIPRDERIITIEDSAELRFSHVENLVRLETRNANSEGKGIITVRDLIKASLRMRPDRIIVGEVRGAEAFDMLQAMNTGHEGSMSTGHSNSAGDMLDRLETMVISAVSLPLEAVRQYIASAIDVIVHLSRLRDKSRRVVEIAEVAGINEGKIMLNRLFIFNEKGEGKDGRLTGSLESTGNRLIRGRKLQMAGFAEA